MSKLLIILFCFILLLYPLKSEARDNPFISKQASKKEVKLPTFASTVFAEIAFWQHKLNSELTKLVKRLKENRSWEALSSLILVSFLYGIIHAAGPGHGKVVVFSYFISRRSTVKKGILLGNLISLFHAISGVMVVLTLYFIVNTAYLASFEATSQKIKLASYTLVILIGLALLIRGLLDAKKGSVYDLHGNGSVTSSDRKGILPLALAVGMVPCPGVVIIMLFSLSLNLLAIGLMMSFTMALGMATTISLAGILSILGQEGLLRGFSRSEKAQNIIQKGLTILGSLLIICFGGILLLGAI